MENSIKRCFAQAVQNFWTKDKNLIASGISERCLCGRLAYHLQIEVDACNKLRGYYADVEYNRICTGDNTYSHKKNNNNLVIVDLILHNRKPSSSPNSNLLILEMKKNSGIVPDTERIRLKEATGERKKDNYVKATRQKANNHNMYNYKLGIFMNIEYPNKDCTFEIYQDGKETKKFSSIDELTECFRNP